MLETFLLIATARILSATQIFEFGTFWGSTTLNFALNTPDETRIFTLDLDLESSKDLSQDACDAPLTNIHLSASAYDFSNSIVRHKITTLNGDSRRFDFSPWNRTIDLAFIDGGHDVPTAAADTCNALQMVRQDTTSCILWHDYRNPEYPDLTSYLDELSVEFEMFHIEDTMLCLSFQGPHNEFTRCLLSADKS